MFAFLVFVTNVHGDTPYVEYLPTPSPLAYVSAQPEPDPKSYLQQLDPQDFATLNAVVVCESGWKMEWNSMHDVDPKIYTAYGYFQILLSTAHHADATLDRTLPYDNLRLGVDIFKKEGLTPWSLSKNCISRLLGEP